MSSVCPPVPASALFRILLGTGLLLGGGCRASEPPASTQMAAHPLHWPVVPPPAELDPAAPVLWVGLAARLGPVGAADPALQPPLTLQSGQGFLTLIDGEGQRFMAPQLTLHWRREPLPQPMVFRREVVGPFGSFESAEAVAEQWRTQGVTAVVARPQDWEVWGPAGAEPPEGFVARPLQRREEGRLALELRRAEGVVALQGPIRIEAPGGLSWKGGLYGGPFRLHTDAHGSWSLVEQVPLERYLEGVVPHEIGAGSPPAALAAQAVLARTWAIRNRHRFRADGYHLCADTQCQVYSDPRQAGSAVRQAIAATRHQVLAWQGQPIHAVYHATNGGVAAGFEEAWSGQPLPYLQAFADGPAVFQEQVALPVSPTTLATLLQGGGTAFGADHPRFRWRRRITADQLRQAVAGTAPQLGTPQRVTVVQRGPSGRAMGLEIAGPGGSTVLRLDAIRRALPQLPSTLFTVTPSETGAWLFTGGGFGHGAGLSQAGAIDLARRGWTTGQILQRYYRGASLEPLGALRESP